MATRINKYLSEVGYCSRREADRLILEGKVTINGKIPEIGTKVEDSDQVEVKGQRIEKYQELKEAVANYCLNASEKIRSESLIAKSITVFVRTSPFQSRFGYYSNSKTIDFAISTNNSIEIVKTALVALDSIFKNGYRYQKAGVMLTGLSNEDGSKNLFSSEKDEKIKGLMKSIDNTNYRYGRSTLSLASAGVQKRWNMRREHSSKIDTADFYCLPTIRAT